MTATRFSFRGAAAALALALCSGFASADTAVNVSIDTGMFGASGWLDLQFNPNGGLYTPPASVTISNFVGFDGGADVFTEGQVSGSLAAGYTIGNGDYWNDLFHAVNYGGVLSFTVTFAGDADLSGNIGQSIFSVAAYAEDQTTTLGSSSSPDGSLFTVTWVPATVAGGPGDIVTAVYSDAASVSAVPEPSAWLMMGIGAVLVAGAARRRQSARLG